jgi:D-alanyl-D-alanine dipeptidase
VRKRVLLVLGLLLGCGHALPDPKLADLGSVDDSIAIDIRYAGENNFMGSRIEGYLAPRCLLSEQAVSALLDVQRELRSRGLGLLVFDCYRPQRAVDHFVQWAGESSDERTKADYYPKLDKSRLIELGYIAARSGHSRGSTIDLTLIERIDDSKWTPMDMGTEFDFFDSSSNTESNDVTQIQRQNRFRLRDAMERGGFQNFPKEWWHYTLRDEPYPNQYWNLPIR